MTKIQYRRDTAANWTSNNPVLAAGEPAFETDTKKHKVGDGVTVWATLPYRALTAAEVSALIAGAVGSSSGEKTVDGLSLTQQDGGNHFYDRFRYGLRSDPYFFPLGVFYSWINAASDIAVDQSAGINFYNQLTNSSNLSYLQGSGSQAILQWSEWGSLYSSWKNSSVVAGIGLLDERDMVYNGAGGDQSQGYADAIAELNAIGNDGRMIYANYGKGVTFYGSDASAARYTNGFQDLTSSDVYWMTDSSTWTQYQGAKLVNGSTAALTSAQGRLGYNYALAVQRQRSLMSPSGSKPVWGFVELSHTTSNDADPTISAAEIKSAAWHQIIAGARGITYFNNQLQNSGFTDYNIIRNQSSVRTALAATNSLIASLAPVLNSPFVSGFCSVPSAVNASVRYWRGDYYILAGSKQVASQSATFTINVSGFTAATVVGESRNVAISSNVLTDTFADQNAIHIYKLTRG